MNKAIILICTIIFSTNTYADNYYKDYFKRATKLIIPEANAGQASTDILPQTNTNINKYVVPELKTEPKLIAKNNVHINTQAVHLNKKTQKGLQLAQKHINSDDYASAGIDGVVRFKYGAGQPTLVCSPLNVCSLMLEKDEILTGHNIGDPDKWHFITPQTGNNIIIIKPKENNLSTNVLVFTLKNNQTRQYSIRLVAHPTKYMPFIAFTHDDENVEYLNNKYYSKIQSQIAKNQTNKDNAKYALSPANLDYSFKVSGKADFDIERVYTDGIKTYIDLKDFKRGDELPIFMAQTNSKKDLLTNHFFDENKSRFIIDYKVNTGYLIAGENKLKITYIGAK